MHVPLAKPSLDTTDFRRIVEVLDSGFITQGPVVGELESAVAARLNCQHVVAVSNGTAALHLALLAHGIGPEDEVVVPAFSYVATANAVELCGAKPVFADIDLASFNINPGAITPLISPRTKAILPVHEFGYPSDMPAILNLADARNLPVIEDAACALGSTLEGKLVGTLGATGCFSLHPRKVVTSGEGGLLATDDPDLAQFFRIMRDHGIDRESGNMDFVAAGFNYRMTDIQAALVIGQIERLNEILAKRSAVAARYEADLKGGYFTKPQAPSDGTTTWQSYHILLNDDVDQAAFLEYLRRHGIGCTYGAQCIPIQTFYREKYGYRPEDFPNATRAFRQGVVIPCHENLSDEQIEHVATTVNKF